MKYEDMVEKLANEILAEAVGEEEMEVEADEIDLYMQEKIAANLGLDNDNSADEAINKIAAYYEQSQMLKQAASEAYLEGEAIEQAAVEALKEIGYFE